MKLFSRESKGEAEDDFDTVDLPTKEDLSEDFFEQKKAKEPDVEKAEPSYTIEDAISLMRNLPKESSDLVVTVVNKTLQSMDVKVEDIIRSAEEKEKRIREHNKALEQEVKELQAKIADRNNEMSTMMADLRETMEVKKRLRIALDIEQKLNRPSNKPVKVEQPASGVNDEMGTTEKPDDQKRPRQEKI